MSLAPGDLLGPYKIQALLGAGGMGEVYRARDTRLGRDAALKVIAPRLLADKTLHRRFELEARAASILNHPAIVTIYDVGETGEISWIAMEWVEGETLRDALSRGALPLERVVSIARDIADGLAVAHAKAIVHRDLKPENIMLRADGRAKILDFGLARQTSSELLEDNAETAVRGDATVEGVVLGTIGYMSPEQASGRTVDFRSDQFNFGLILYEMLAGQRAFARLSKMETLAAIMRDDPTPLRSIRAGIPQSLDDVIRRCLAKQADDRFASTRELAATLEAIAAEPSMRTTAPLSPSLVPTDVLPVNAAGATRSIRPRRRVVVAISVSVTIALATAAWMRFHRSSSAIESLAVLPFENASNDPSAQYLADGLSESLIDQMSRLPELKVMARTTVSRFRKGSDPLASGRQLGVGAVLVGTISRSPSQLVVSAELVEIPSGVRLWGRTYDRPASDLLRVQDSIAWEIADGLRLGLSRNEKQSLVAHTTKNPEAYELFLKARFLLQHDTEEDDLEARSLYLQAVEKDPSFADAYLGVATTYARSAGNGYASPAEAWTSAGEYARRALDVDPGNFGARVSLAVRHFLFDWDWPLAEREFRELSNDPRLFTTPAHQPVALYYWATGRPEQSIALMERALSTDPQNLESRVMRADFFAAAGKLEESIRSYQEIIRSAPGDARPRFGLAEAFRRRGDLAAAVAALRVAYELADEPAGVEALAGATSENEYDAAQVAVARERLQILESLAGERYVSPIDLARLMVKSGKRDQALATLEQAVRERSPGVVFLEVDHVWDPVRDDPRFASIVGRMKFP